MNKKLNFGLIGCGRIGIMHARNIVNLVPNANLYAVVDPFLSDAAKAELLELGVPENKISKDLDSFLLDPGIDAFFVATPTNTHPEVLLKIIHTNKKPIFSEKPTGVNWMAIAAIRDEIVKSGVPLQIGYNRRFDVHFKDVKDAVEKDKVGKIFLVSITDIDPLPPSAKYVKTAGMTWVDMNIHDFDMLRYVTGQDIVEVYATGANLIPGSEELIGYDVDFTTVQLTLSGGALALIKSGKKSTYGYDQSIEVHGNKGRAKIENLKPSTLSIVGADGKHTRKAYHSFIERYPDAYKNEIVQFVNNVLAKKPVSPSIDDDIWAMKVAFACEKSYKEHRPVKLSEIN